MRLSALEKVIVLSFVVELVITAGCLATVAVLNSLSDKLTETDTAELRHEINKTLFYQVVGLGGTALATIYSDRRRHREVDEIEARQDQEIEMQSIDYPAP